MISVCTKEFDLLGSFIISERLGIVGNRDTLTRRISKSATLDGGVFINDGGLSHGDRSFQIQLNSPSQSLIDTIKYMIEYHSDFTISKEDGLFSGVIEDLSDSGTRYTVSLSVREKLT
jgi:hypothetical protein